MVYPALADGIAPRWFRKFSFASPVTVAECVSAPRRHHIRRVPRVHGGASECDRNGDQHAERGPRPHARANLWGRRKANGRLAGPSAPNVWPDEASTTWKLAWLMASGARTGHWVTRWSIR